MLRRFIVSAICGLAALTLCDRPGPVMLGSFNIRMFPEAGTDLEAVARAISELDADAFAVQEIVEPAVFRGVLAWASALAGRDYQVALEPAHCPRRRGLHHVGVVYDAAKLTLETSRMLGEFTCPPGQPAGMYALLRASDGRRLALASVHFSASSKPATITERMAQWTWLVEALPELEAELGAPVVVAGDFNSTGFLMEDHVERRFIDAIVAQHALQLPTAALGCSMYWKPGKARLYEGSLLDHVLASDGLTFGAPEAFGMCAELACAPVSEAPAAWKRVSDHCPVRVPLRW